MNLKLVGKTALKFADKHLPEILSMVALLGLGGAIVSATKKAPEAVEAVDEAKSEKLIKLLKADDEKPPEERNFYELYQDENGNIDYDRVKLNPWEWFKACAPVYWDTWLIGLASGICIILSNRISTRRYAAVLAALSLNEKRLKEWKEKAKEILGEKKVEEIEEEIVKDKVMDMPEEAKGFYEIGQNYPCYFKPLDAWISSNRTKIGDAFNRINAIGISTGEVTLEDIANEFDIPIKDPSYYESQIWEFNNYDRDKLEPKYYKPDRTLDGIPALPFGISRPYNRARLRNYN